MAEPALSISRNVLRQRVGEFLGWGRGSTAQSGGGDVAWSDNKLAEINFLVESGERQFYHTPAVPGQHPGGHPWTFLRPRISVTLNSGQRYVVLPDDCGGVEGEVVVSRSGQSVTQPIKLTNDGQIARMFATLPDATGQPLYMALQPTRDFTPGSSQQLRLAVYPEADTDYTLSFQTYLLPNSTTATRPYVYGGPEHAETVLASCLAIAEQRKDQQRGVEWQMFVERLLASIRMDDRKRPHSMGVQGDGSRRNSAIDPWGYTVTFNGVEYD